MRDRFKAICLEDFAPAPVNRPRLARYLELPSVAQIDPITDAEIRRLDARRGDLVSIWHRAVAVPIEYIDGRRIGLNRGLPPIEATDAYARQLIDSDAEALIVAAFTLGGRVDQVIRSHLEQEEVYEAFILKQWAATMAEQARASLTRGLRAWANDHGDYLLPYDGPGYNGWPLRALSPLLETLYQSPAPVAARPVRATDSGALLPTNSMLIVHGLTCRRGMTARHANHDDRLAQCYRCAMQNCSYRVAPMPVAVGVG